MSSWNSPRIQADPEYCFLACLCRGQANYRYDGIEAVVTDSINGHKPIKEIIIKADNEYRIFYVQEREAIIALAYCKKTSPQAQKRAIDRAAARFKQRTQDRKEPRS